ncbi:hypothetical protein Anas_08258 [Armadillidium nasatum]|uniref:Uncharacterized protein n=1 Tax=Armadillidium nasatum TaxID=96803 RepID=A0A5N5SPD6_9CRUS|nr:hypothetical protein Anas_08258 [Armadillidium nasatum]
MLRMYMLMVVLLASSFYLELEGAPNPYRPYGGGAYSRGGFNARGGFAAGGGSIDAGRSSGYYRPGWGGGGGGYSRGGFDARGGFAAGGGSISGGGGRGYYRACEYSWDSNSPPKQKCHNEYFNIPEEIDNVNLNV